MRLACAALFLIQALIFAAAAGMCAASHRKGAAMVGIALMFANWTGFALSAGRES